MAKKRKHWTQTIAGKRKMAKAQKAAWHTRKNGGSKKVHTQPKDAPEKSSHNSGRTLAREQLAELAREGAQTRLIKLEREAEKLRAFLGISNG
jgi:hypothetical protein